MALSPSGARGATTRTFGESPLLYRGSLTHHDLSGLVGAAVIGAGRAARVAKNLATSARLAARFKRKKLSEGAGGVAGETTPVEPRGKIAPLAPLAQPCGNAPAGTTVDQAPPVGKVGLLDALNQLSRRHPLSWPVRSARSKFLPLLAHPLQHLRDVLRHQHAGRSFDARTRCLLRKKGERPKPPLFLERLCRA
jgi:hypothetical protein